MHPLQKILEKLSHKYNFQVRPYSGQFMGRMCLAIVGDINPFQLGFEIAIADLDNEENEEVDIYDFESYATDNMGRSTIHYWKRIDYTDPKENENEEEE